MVTQPLSLFRWRAKQRRMVTDLWRDCKEDRFVVSGKTMTVEFVFDRIGADPASKLKKMARIYKPDAAKTPINLLDITLYVRV